MRQTAPIWLGSSPIPAQTGRILGCRGPRSVPFGRPPGRIGAPALTRKAADDYASCPDGSTKPAPYGHPVGERWSAQASAVGILVGAVLKSAHLHEHRKDAGAISSKGISIAVIVDEILLPAPVKRGRQQINRSRRRGDRKLQVEGAHKSLAPSKMQRLHRPGVAAHPLPILCAGGGPRPCTRVGLRDRLSRQAQQHRQGGNAYAHIASPIDASVGSLTPAGRGCPPDARPGAACDPPGEFGVYHRLRCLDGFLSTFCGLPCSVPRLALQGQAITKDRGLPLGLRGSLTQRAGLYHLPASSRREVYAIAPHRGQRKGAPGRRKLPDLSACSSNPTQLRCEDATEQANIMGKVFGYIRVSTDRQAEKGESLGEQRRQLEGYALQHGWPLAEVFTEEGVSGSIPLADRPAGARLLAVLRAGDAVAVPKLDRVFRSALDALQTVEDFKRRGVALHLLDLGGDVSGNGLSKLFLTVAAAFAEAERDRIRERITGVKRDQKARGRYLGGKLPFGFRVGEDRGLEPIPEQQAAIQRACSLRADGKPLRAIRAALEAEHGVSLSLEALSRIVRETPAAAPAPQKEQT